MMIYDECPMGSEEVLSEVIAFWEDADKLEVLNESSTGQFCSEFFFCPSLSGLSLSLWEFHV